MPNNKLRIQDAANYLGVSAKTLRRWEKSKKLIPERSDGDQRYYDLQILNEHLKKTNGVITNKSLDINHGVSSVSKWLLATSSFVFIFFFGLYKFQTYKNNSLTSSVSRPSVLAASTGTNGVSQKYTFTVNVPAKFNDSVTFTKDIEAPNMVTSVNGSTGEVNIDFELTAGTGISVDGLKVTNSGIVSLTAGDGISVSGSTITNTGIKSLEAGSGISISGNTITNTYTFTPDYSLSGWTDGGTTVGLSAITDSVVVDTITYGNATVTNGHSIVPDTDLGSDLGSSLYRFNNLWVGTINSNSSQGFSGQTTFSYPPTSTAITEASVLINPTTSIDNGQLLGLGIAGYQRALIDEDGDMILGYNSLTSAPTSDYPLNIYGHSGTRVSFTDTSGNGHYAGNLGVGTTSPTSKLHVSGAVTGKALTIFDETGNQNILTASASGVTKLIVNNSGYLGIGTTTPAYRIDLGLDAGVSAIRGYGFKLGIVGSDTHIGQINYIYGNSGVGRISFYESQSAISIQSFNNSTARNVIQIVGATGPNSYNHPQSTNPTLFVHSETGSTTATDQWISFSHDQTNGVISTGKGSLILSPFAKVGIGISNPGYNLDINGGNNSGLTTQIKATYHNGLTLTSGGDSYQNLLSFNQTTDWAMGVMGNVYGPDFVIYTNYLSPALLIDSATNNVGIGTTAPGAKLDIAGGIRLQGASSGYVGFTAATSGSSVTYTLPSEDGTEGQVLSTNGLGTLSWVDAGTATASASTGTSVSLDISATAITPGTAFASTSYWTTPPSRAFDLVLDSVDNGWINDGGTTGYIGYDFGVQSLVNKYTVYPFSNGGSMDRNPKDWVFESSNNNVDWTTLDTQVNQTSWTFPVSNIYLISNSTAYRYYRLRFTANNGNGYTAIAELKLFSTLNTGTQWTTTGSNIYFSTGNVGVGENAPISKLHVTGAVKGKALAIFDETGDQNIITASSSGITKLTVAKNGLVNASVGGLATFSKAGTISDVDFSDTAVDGLMGFDSTNGRLYIRNGGVWSYIAKTAGFQIPDYESVGLSEGDLLLPYVEKKMEDGAIHGLYTKLEDSKPITDINSKFSFILNAIDTINTKIAEIKTKIDSLTNEIFTNKSHQETLCIGPKDAETCIDKNQLDSILNSLATPSSSPVSESPVPTATSSPLPSPEITEDTPVEATASPSASPTP